MTGSWSRRTPADQGRPWGWESWPASGAASSSRRASESADESRGGREPTSESPGRPASGGQRPADPASGSVPEDSPEVVPDPAVREPGGDEPSIEAEVIVENDPLAEMALERDEYRDALIRLQADFENYKKRILKQQTEHLERAAQSLVEKLLPVLDTADLALAHGGGEDVKQITTALVTSLEREGLERIDPSGGPFDPTLHEAVAHEPSEGGEQEVAEVLRAGYRWKGRVLRPAMVKVRG
jgi:molecular chaperone GrpE